MAPPGDGRCDPVEVRRSRRSVRQGDAVEHERRGEGAENEVLHRRLARRKGLREEPREDVERQRHELERQEQDDEIARGREEHHPGRGEEHEGVVLARLRTAPPDVVHREEQAQRGRIADHDVHEQGEIVEDDHVVERATGLAPARERREERAHDARERDRSEDLLALGARREVEE